MAVQSIFQPFELCGLRLENRIAMASTARWSAPGGDPTALADFYRRRAEGGAGLILTEGVAIDRPAAYNSPATPHMFGPALEGWRAVVAAVHGAGAKIMPQLWHCGAVPKKASDWAPPGEPESPSGLIAAGQPRGRAMTDADIEGVLDAYGRAAAAAAAIGFDGVEIHAGHGYLLDQFLWGETNRRADRWGGAILTERSRFPLEAVRTVRRATPAGRPVMVRISNWKSADLTAQMAANPDELAAWLVPFVEAGADILSVSALRYDAPLFDGSDLSFAGWVKRVTGAPVMTAGGIGMSGDFMQTFAGQAARPEPVDEAARRLEAGEYDLIAVGRALLADPAWTCKVRDGASEPLVACEPAMLAASTAN
jgi:2,4-dienoyl-CoA reductase-like NADH-dependent reductase (Old Yellow Enzyme family)